MNKIENNTTEDLYIEAKRIADACGDAYYWQRIFNAAFDELKVDRERYITEKKKGIWNYDITNIPRGHYETVIRKAPATGKEFEAKVFRPERVILATKCGKVTLSRFIPEEDRWEMLAKREDPLAWMEWPKHPNQKEV